MFEIKYKFLIDFEFNLFSLLMYCSTIQLVFFFRSFCCLYWKGLQISHGNKLLCHADNCIRSLLCFKVILYVYTVSIVFIHYSQYIICGFYRPCKVLNFPVNLPLPPSITEHHCIKELRDCVSCNVPLMLSLHLVIFKDELSESGCCLDLGSLIRIFWAMFWYSNSFYFFTGSFFSLFF